MVCRCGLESNLDGSYSLVVVVQRAGDKAFQLFCYFDTQTKVITNGYEKLFLRIEIDRASIYGIFAKNLRAISPADSDEIELLDSRGCPTDPVIFPGLEKVPGSEDLQSSFEAFKFSDTSVAKFQVNVAFCLGGCNPSTAATDSCPTAYGDARPRPASLGCGGGTRRRGCSTRLSWGRRCWSAARPSPRRSSWRRAPRWTHCRRGAVLCWPAGTAVRVRRSMII